MSKNPKLETLKRIVQSLTRSGVQLKSPHFCGLMVEDQASEPAIKTNVSGTFWWLSLVRLDPKRRI